MATTPLKVALLADTHGFLDPRVAEVVAECDIAVHAGDIGGADILFALNPRQEVIAIRGNNDDAGHWAENEQDILTNLGAEASVDLPGGRLKVVHGDDGGTLEQRHRRYRRQYSDYRAIVYGHSHRQNLACDEDPWLLNPGAAGRTRTQGGPSCLVLTCDEQNWKVEAKHFPKRSYRAHRPRTHD